MSQTYEVNVIGDRAHIVAMSQNSTLLSSIVTTSSSSSAMDYAANTLLPTMFIPSIVTIVLMAMYVFALVSFEKGLNTFPITNPIMGEAIPFIWDGMRFFQHMIENTMCDRTIRVSLGLDDIYIVQRPQNVATMLRMTSLTVSRAYALVLRHCFGMGKTSVDAYLADISGSRSKPIPGTCDEPRARIFHMTHENLTEGLLTDGLEAASIGFQNNLKTSLESLNIYSGWVDMPDLTTFFEDHVGTPLLRTLFGDKLLEQSPTFTRDLWSYDKSIMALARRTPRFLIPQAYRLRDNLVATVKSWHHDTFRSSERAAPFQPRDRNSSPCMKFVQERYRMLMSAAGQDENSVASTDMAFIWASITNVVPSSEVLVLQSLQDPDLLSTVRQTFKTLKAESSDGSIGFERLEKSPLLLSMYAETLRLVVQIHVPRVSSSHEVVLGGTTIPRNKLIITNTRSAHMDPRYWGSKNDQHPPEMFWAERFLVTREDTSSQGTGAGHKRVKDGVQFSVEDTEGSWIPFGGGQHACPGRLLARRIMLLSCYMILEMYDIELLASKSAMRLTSPRFGFGVQKPAGVIPFRIRKRQA